MTAGLTLVGGMLLFIISEFIRVAVIVPVQNLKEQLQTALERVDFYSNRLTNYFPAKPSREEIELINQIKGDLRAAATRLRSKYSVISMKRLAIRLNFIPDATNIDIAYSGLIYLHNSILLSSRRDFVINEIEMNHNHIERIQAALSGNEVPAIVEPRERQD